MVAFSDVSGTKKVVFGRVREFPRLEISGTGMSGISRLKIFGNRVPNVRELLKFENFYC